MKKLLLAFIVVLIGFNSFAQITYEKGYFIDNQGNKTVCLIKNVQWNNNPTEFDFKLTETSGIQTASIDSIVEFGVENKSKFKRSIVEIDRSRTKIGGINSESQPNLVEEQLFLKVLIEGKGSLYLYDEDNINYYFYSIDESKIEPLIYKRYSYNTTEYLANTEIRENNKYKQQLWEDTKCETLSMEDIKRLSYRKDDFVRYFTAYNECQNSTFYNYVNKKGVDFNLSFHIGVASSSLKMDNTQNGLSAKFDRHLSPYFGLEAEFIMPFNRNKWAATVGTTYRSFKGETEGQIENTPYTEKYTIALKILEITAGIRHYMFLNKNSKLFIDGGFSLNMVNTKAEYLVVRPNSSSLEKLEMDPSTAIGFLGFGYNLNNRYSIQIKYRSNMELFGNYIFLNSQFNTISLNFGYRFL